MSSLFALVAVFINYIISNDIQLCQHKDVHCICLCSVDGNFMFFQFFSVSSLSKIWTSRAYTVSQRSPICGTSQSSLQLRSFHPLTPTCSTFLSGAPARAPPHRPGLSLQRSRWARPACSSSTWRHPSTLWTHTSTDTDGRRAARKAPCLRRRKKRSSLSWPRVHSDPWRPWVKR